jgi:hypothetical protein
MPINMSYPKPRDMLVKIVPIARTDSSTVKCVLPKDAVICQVFVHQDANAVTNTATFDLGFTGDTDGILNDFTMATTAVGFVAAGATAGSAVGTKLDSDKQIISTYTVGSSTAGGTGYVYIHYFVAGPGEGLTS